MTRRRRCFWALVALTAHVLSPSEARASVPEDMQGMHPRTIAMGGAGTALHRDYSLAYYNPAGLSFCPNSHVGVDVRSTFYDLDTSGQAVESGTLGPREPLPNQSRFNIGLCNHFPFKLSFGFAIGLGIPNVIKLDIVSPDSNPRFVQYGANLDVLSATLGLAYRPVKRFSVGIGASILVSAGIDDILADIPIRVDEDGDGMYAPVALRIPGGIQLSIAPYVGFHYIPVDGLHLGLAYRGEMFFDFDATIDVEALALFIPIKARLDLQNDAWYSPRQIAFGASYDPTSWVTLSADLTWYNYAFYERERSGPFLNVTIATPPEDCVDESNVACDLVAPPREDYGYRNIVVPRLGGEMRFLDQRLATRMGYSFRPAAVRAASLRDDGNILDNAVHGISAGVGYHVGSFAPRAEDGLPEVSDELHLRGKANLELDLYGRLSVLPRREGVTAAEGGPAESYDYGGLIYDFGLAATFGWY